ncbi:basic proline-rich protein-like [Gorilla gorilla gorilla]|uniref:basic proline-rich protein-like n=1 Tax=Gorilla gorilla gorilla TaxID=9595 RepID=UPI00300A28E4
MCAMRVQMTKFRERRVCPTPPRPLAGTLGGRPGQHGVAPPPAGRERLQNKAWSPAPAPARPTLNQPPGGKALSTRALQPGGALEAGTRGGPEGHRRLRQPPIPSAPPGAPLHERFLLIALFPSSQSRHGSAGRGLAGRLQQVRPGAAGPRGKSLSLCGRCSRSPPAAPPPPGFFFSFAPRSCHGLPGRLPWVTGPRPAGSLPAAQSPPPAERSGRDAAGARVCWTQRGGCARAAEAPQPTGGRGCSRGSATASGVGGKAIKKAQR